MSNDLRNAGWETIANDQAAGQTTISSSVVDMAGYDSVCFITKLGTLDAGAVVGVKIQQGAASNLSDAADLADTNIAPADDDDDKLVLHDIHRPQERYLRVQVTRATADAEIDCILARKYNPKSAPVTQDTDHVASSEFHLSPAEGTA